MKPSELERGHRALGLLFAALGVTAGAWGVHVASVKTQYELSERGLSLVLFAGALGAISSLLVSGRVVARLGTRAALRVTGVAQLMLLSVMLLWPNAGAVWLGAFALGVFISVHDVALNAEGTSLETQIGRPIMGGLHAMFSLGAMAGAAICAGLLHLQWPAALQLAAISGALLALVLAVAPSLPDAHPAVQPGQGPRHFIWPRGPLLLIGLLIFAGMLAEGVMMDWTVLYLQQAQSWPQDVAAAGFAVFVGAMALARFLADRARARWGDGRVLQACAGLACVSISAGLFWPNPAVLWPALAGAGIGLAPVVPLLYTAASKVPGSTSAAALAAASSIGYSGFLVGPPLIGSLAQSFSLSVAMWAVPVSAALLAVGASRLSWWS